MRVRGGVLLGFLLIGDFSQPITNCVSGVLLKAEVHFARVLGA
jgi:hypothetical protein